MSHYSDNPRDVRVDFFKKSGKWYTTECVTWEKEEWSGDKILIHTAFRTALARHFKNRRRLEGMQAICLEPYHQHSHPISVMIDEQVYEWMRPEDTESSR